MRRTSMTVLAALVAAAALPAVGEAAKTLTFKGKATNVAGDFDYGPVSVKRKGARVTRVKIEAVTATCPFGTTTRTIVFNPADSGIKILSGSSKVKDGKMSVTYLPDETVEDQKTTLKLTFKSKSTRVSGRFSETSICVDEGKFSAKR